MKKIFVLVLVVCLIGFSNTALTCGSGAYCPEDTICKNDKCYPVRNEAAPGTCGNTCSGSTFCNYRCNCIPTFPTIPIPMPNPPINPPTCSTMNCPANSYCNNGFCIPEFPTMPTLPTVPLPPTCGGSGYYCPPETLCKNGQCIPIVTAPSPGICSVQCSTGTFCSSSCTCIPQFPTIPIPLPNPPITPPTCATIVCPETSRCFNGFCIPEFPLIPVAPPVPQPPTCGGFGQYCPPETLCKAGKCVPIITTPTPGACNTSCSTGTFCNGNCICVPQFPTIPIPLPNPPINPPTCATISCPQTSYCLNGFCIPNFPQIPVAPPVPQAPTCGGSGYYCPPGTLCKNNQCYPIITVPGPGMCNVTCSTGTFCNGRCICIPQFPTIPIPLPNPPITPPTCATITCPVMSYCQNGFCIPDFPQMPVAPPVPQPPTCGGSGQYCPPGTLCKSGTCFPIITVPPPGTCSFTCPTGTFNNGNCNCIPTIPTVPIPMPQPPITPPTCNTITCPASTWCLNGFCIPGFPTTPTPTPVPQPPTCGLTGMSCPQGYLCQYSQCVPIISVDPTYCPPNQLVFHSLSCDNVVCGTGYRCRMGKCINTYNGAQQSP